MNFNLIAKLIPPDDPRKETQWRWLVFITLVLLLFNGAIGRGIMLGVGSYAYASDVAKNEKAINRVLVLGYARELRNLRIDECIANGSKSAIRAAMEEFQLDYIELTGIRYPLLSCEELKTT